MVHVYITSVICPRPIKNEQTRWAGPTRCGIMLKTHRLELAAFAAGRKPYPICGARGIISLRRTFFISRVILEKYTRSNFVHRFSWYYLEFLLLPSTFYGCLAGHLCMVVHLSRAERVQFITKITVIYLDMLKSPAVVASKEIEGH
jgi:hypothetical protein